jgi:hypothetical protein
MLRYAQSSGKQGSKNCRQADSKLVRRAAKVDCVLALNSSLVCTDNLAFDANVTGYRDLGAGDAGHGGAARGARSGQRQADRSIALVPLLADSVEKVGEADR